MSLRPRRLLLGAIACLGAAVTAAAVYLAMLLSYSPRYDEDHPDHRRYAERFEALRVRLDGQAATRQEFVDFTDLNGGEWKTACLFGGYTDPLREMKALGADIDDKDRARLTEAGRRGFRLAPIEEFEIAIAYVDPGNKARFIHMKSGIGPWGQHFNKCIARPQTRLAVGSD